MTSLAWAVALAAAVVYGLMLATSRGTAQAFAPVFVILVLLSAGYLSQRQERNRARRP
jgi:hypothetical protein